MKLTSIHVIKSFFMMTFFLAYTLNSNSTAQLVESPVRVDVDKTISALTSLLHELKTNTGGVMDTSISGCVNQVTQNAKLVVATVDVAVTLTNKIENSDVLGVTTVGWQLMVVKAPENRVQFFIDLRQIKASNLIIDEKNFALRFVVPRPSLDEPMIHIDPKVECQFVSTGPGHLSDARILEIMDEMKKTELTKEVLKQAQSKTSKLVVAQAGRMAVEQLLRKIFMNDKLFGKMPWLRIDVVYEDEVPDFEETP